MLANGFPHQLRSFMTRHKVRIFDGAVLVIITLTALFYCFEVDVFANEPGEGLKANTLELDEVLLVSAIFCGGLVIFALRRLAEQKRETARRIAAEQEIRTLAFHDALTGLPNRRQFDDALRAAIAAPPRAGGSHAVLLLDLNGFKRVNDVFGHAVGDEVLIRVAGRLSQCVRGGDLVARLGGDEFVVLSQHISGPEAATGLALRIIDSLDDAVQAGGSNHAIGAAIGVALAPQDGADPTELLRKADIALYRAKTQGKSALRFFEPEMDAQIQERDGMERALRAAIQAGDIQPFYQPLIDLKSGGIRGFEALARWTGENLETVGPDRFIPIAEDSGLIGPLSDQLLERACLNAHAWPAGMVLAFNVSPMLLRDPTFALRVLAILARTGLAPNRLELEITESALVNDFEAAQAALSGLRDAGVRIAIDNFGTGYSSLYHLRNFKIDRLKIDRSFVGSMASDKDSAAIVRALVGLGEGLGLQVTAEGVETLAQQRLLIEQGCDQAQGFLYSQPLPAEEVLAMLAPGGRRYGQAG
jgi:diguanylate cyclase (GGDEF)-like protein